MAQRRVIELSEADAIAFELSKHIVQVLELWRTMYYRAESVLNGHHGSAKLPVLPEDELGYFTIHEMAEKFRKSTKAFASLEQRDPEIRALRVQDPDKKRQPRLYSKRRTIDYLKKLVWILIPFVAAAGAC